MIKSVFQNALCYTQTVCAESNRSVFSASIHSWGDKVNISDLKVNAVASNWGI